MVLDIFMIRIYPETHGKPYYLKNDIDFHHEA